LISAQKTADVSPDFEALGTTCANMLCEEIAKGGCVDTAHQIMALLFMMLGSEDVSRIRTGPLAQST
jgi:RNA 3'-terminal phosphate cyclase-like protein